MIRPHSRFRTLLVGLALLLTQASLSTGAVAATGQTRLEAENGQGYRGILSFAAASLVTMRPTAFRLELYGPDGQRTMASAVSCDLTMPAMPMPENRPRLTVDGNAYRGAAVFTMAGAWQARVTVHQAGGVASTLVFTIDRVLLK